MITDHIQNAMLYFSLGERIKKALLYLRETDFSNVKPDKYIIDGENIYAMVQHYETLPQEKCPLEAHKKYIDVQYMIEGEECIGYEPLDHQEIAEDYHDNEDYSLFNGNPSLIRYSQGMFAILFPQDLHQPRVIAEKSMMVKKVVVKVKL